MQADIQEEIKNEQDNIRNGMRIYTNDRQHNITAGVPFF